MGLSVIILILEWDSLVFLDFTVERQNAAWNKGLFLIVHITDKTRTHVKVQLISYYMHILKPCCN